LHKCYIRNRMRCNYRAFISLFLFFRLLSFPAFTQEGLTHTKDSLLNVIPSLTGEEKLNAYDRLHTIYMDNLFDDASLEDFFALSTEYATEARNQNATKQQGDIMLNNLIANLRMNHFDEVDKNIDNTLAFLKEHALTDAMYIAYKQQILSYCRRGMYAELCNMLQATGRFDEFFDMAGQTEELLEKLSTEDKHKDHNTDKMNLWTLYAFAYNSKGEYDKAEAYCNRIDSLHGRDAVSLGNITYLHSHIWEARGDYSKALAYINKAIETDPTYTYARFTKVRILSRMENAPLTWAETEETVEYIDSLRCISYDRQLDELRTQYEVDKHIAEKERVRNFMYFALAGYILLIITLGIWIYYNRQITKKNKALVKQIKELQTQHERAETELLNKTSFGIEDTDNHLCPETRKDQLCMAIRDVLLKEKAYRDPTITRDHLSKRLGSNKDLFIDAFQYCFGMSFPEYLNFLRLKDAIPLLEGSDLTIEEISEKVGFGTVRTFQRQFQSRYNMSPKDYRKAAIA